MWAVVVLGILSAVFAWVWFGGRGHKKGSETRDSEVTAEAVRDAKEQPGVQYEAGSADTSNEEKLPASGELPVPHQEEDGCSFTPAKPLAEGRREVTNSVSAEETLNAPLASELMPVRAAIEQVSHCLAPESQVAPEEERARVAPEEKKLSHTHQMVNNAAALEEEERVRVAPEEEKLPHTHQIDDHAAALKEEERNGRAECSSPVTAPPAQTHAAHLLNGGESSVTAQEDHVTVCLEDNLTEDSSSNVTEDVDDGKLREECRSLSKLSERVSPEKVHISSENNLQQYSYMKPDSPEQSEKHNQLSANQESTAGSQNYIVYGNLAATNHVSSETDSKELSNTQKLEDEVLTCPTGTTEDTLLNVSNLEEDNLDLKGASLSEISCLTSQPEARLQDSNSQRTKRVAAVQPMPQNVSLGFKVHYITSSDSQMIAVTGDHEKLGKWEVYIPLTPEKDGLWSHSITLPGDTDVEWKFVMVENGKIIRWEECKNRCLKTAPEDNAPQQWWGYP